MGAAQNEASSRASNVLIVDDEKEPRQALALLLTSAGFNVSRAADAETAVEQLAGGDAGLVLIDADMPGVDGFELCRRIRCEYGADLYLILRSSKEALFSRELSMDEGADDFLIVPHSDQEALARVETGQKMKQLQERLEQTNRSLALVDTTDPLTGVYKKRRTDAEIQEELERARRYGRSLSLAIVDIDSFRDLNEKLGRSAGDRVLKETARLLSGSLRRSDILGRYGGEQFAVILPETGRRQALGAAEKLRKLVGDTPMTVADKTVHVTVSVGIATFTSNNFDHADGLVGAAQQALGGAKQAGRNRCVAHA
ncbi:MAG: diguanylate cyclase [Planctomycetota bacterium]